MNHLILILLVLGGPGTLAATPVWVIRRLRFAGRAAATTGEVVACEREKNADAGTSDAYRLTVRYRLPDGRDQTFTGSARTGYAEGALIKVLYDPARPERARLDIARRDIWSAAVFLIFFGVICTALLLGYRHRLTG